LLDGGAPAAQRVRLFKARYEDMLEVAFFGQPRREGALLHFAGLPRETLYTVWVPPDERGRYGLVRDARPGPDPVVVRLQQGKTIQGRLTVPEGARDLSVSASLEGLSVQGTLDGKGGYEIRGVPPGRWQVMAYANVADAHAMAQAEAEGGQTLDLVLVAR
jgi:hypothetical protein